MKAEFEALDKKYGAKNKQIEALENEVKSLNFITTCQRQENKTFQAEIGLNKIEMQANKTKIRDLESNVHEYLESISKKNARIKQLESDLNEYVLKEAKKKESPFYKMKKFF